MFEILASSPQGPKFGVGEVLAPYVWAAAISYVVASIATPLIRAIARRWRIVDKPDTFLKPHERPIAYLGGIAVLLGWVVGMLVVVPGEGRSWAIALAVAGTVALLVGLADDLLEIRPIVKLAGQALAGAILLAFGVGLDFVPNMLSMVHIPCPQWLGMTLSSGFALLLVVAACNATNLLDGMDGLCSGVTGIISLMFLVLATYLAMHGYSVEHDAVRMVAALAMVGAVCGFLPYNLSPATIFLGDAGSMLLGLFAAAMILMFGERGVARWVLGSTMIFGLPILDTFLALVRRLRLHRSIFVGDRSHLYDQLVDRGFTVKETLAICYGLSIFYGLVGAGIILLRTRYALPAYLVVAVITLCLCRRWGFLQAPAATPLERTSQDQTQAQQPPGPTGQ